MTVSDWRLHDEREFLRRSLEDATREHAAGDLSDEDFALLKARDERRLAEVEAALSSAVTRREASSVGDAATVTAADVAAGTRLPARRASRGRLARRRRWWLAAVGLALVVAGAVLLVVDQFSPRLPGESATGSIDLNTAQKIVRQLAEAQVLVHRAKDIEALSLYGQVLTEDPRQPVALAEWGWLDWQAATKAKEKTVAAEGASALVEAVKLEPSLAPAQFYLGSVLVQEGDPGKAVAHFCRFLADRPGSAWLKEAAPEIRTAYADLGRPAPAGLPSS